MPRALPSFYPLWKGSTTSRERVNYTLTAAAGFGRTDPIFRSFLLDFIKELWSLAQTYGAMP